MGEENMEKTILKLSETADEILKFYRENPNSPPEEAVKNCEALKYFAFLGAAHKDKEIEILMNFIKERNGKNG